MTTQLVIIEYFKENYRLIAIGLSKLKDPQQINFIGKLENHGATMFPIIEKSEETTFEFLQNLVNIL